MLVTSHFCKAAQSSLISLRHYVVVDMTNTHTHFNFIERSYSCVVSTWSDKVNTRRERQQAADKYVDI